MSKSNQAGRFDRGARWHLILMAALLTFVVSSTIYRFTLPTDGWLVSEAEGNDAYGLIYQENIMGVSSGLQQGDHVLAVEGISLADSSLNALWPLLGDWKAGDTVRYTVLRGGREVQLDVALMKWDLLRLASVNQVTDFVPGFLGIAVFFAVGVLAFWRRPDLAAARALWVMAASLFIFALAGLSPPSISNDIFPIATVSGEVLFAALFTILLPPAFIRFALVFPKPIPALQRRPWIGYIPYAIGVVGMAVFLLGFWMIGFAWMALSILIALAILVHNALTMRDSVSRAQLRWGLGGMVAGLGLFFLTYIAVFFNVPGPVEELLNRIAPLGLAVMGVALGIAVLRYRLFDIDVIIRKTLVYSALTLLLALVYFGVVILLQALFSRLTGGQQSTLAVVVSTLVIAALFTPLRRRIQDWIDRRFYRRKYNAQQVLAQFAQTARDETDLDALLAELVRVVDETLQPEHVSVWLRPALRAGSGSAIPEKTPS